jgi:diguanylate cyclase (GGDEF)-like protein
MNILLVEDDELIAPWLADQLRTQNFTVDLEMDGEAGWQRLDSIGYDYDLVLLDVGLPKLDGISLCQRLRSRNDRTPVLLLTAHEPRTSQTMAADAGADGYMTKPFDLPNLLDRIKVLLKPKAATPPITEIAWQNIQLDPQSGTIACAGQPLPLTPKESGLLTLFLQNPGRIFSSGMLIEYLWSLNEPPTEDTVRTHLKGLRHKLKTAGVADNPIETIYGIGYRLRQKSPDRSVASTHAKTRNVGWEPAKRELDRRITTIEQAIAELQQHQTVSEKRQVAARREAHKLAGSLGLFGSEIGARLARDIEQLLQHKHLTQQHVKSLADFTKHLRQALQQLDPMHLAENLAPPHPLDERPLLLVVEPDPSIAQSMVVEAEERGMRVRRTASLTLDAIAGECPDAIILELTADDTAEQTRNLIAQLNARNPPVPAIVLTDRDSLVDRVNLTRLGARGVLPKPASPAQILDTTAQILQRDRAAQARIMAVDDDPNILSALQMLLTPWGLKVFTLNNPLKFLEMLRLVSPDLLVLDVEMPDINGIELCQAIRHDPQWYGLPILFLSARTDTITRHQVFLAGADDYVSKPIVAPELVTRILNRLERSRLMRNMAEIDALTGVANRRKSTQDIEQFLLLAERQHKPLSLAILDLDHFKHVNDCYGHGMGDRVLQQLGKLLRTSFRGEDVVARWGGEEFIVGMYNTTRSLAVQRIEEVLELLRQQVFVSDEGDSFQVTFSAGIAQYPQDGTDLQVLYKAADTTLYRAKTAGRNRVLISEPSSVNS